MPELSTVTCTFENKTIDLADNTVQGTKAEFNAALTDGDFATLAGSETLTNKTISGASNTLTNIPTASVVNLSGTNSGDETASSIGAIVNGAAAATPNNADLVATVEASVVKKITWTAVKAFLKTYFDTLYASASGGSETTTTIGALVNGATAKTTPVDADMVGLMDSEASNVLKKLSWANIKAGIKSYYDSVTATLTNKTINGSNNTISNIAESMLSTSDVTTLDVSTTKHGFAPKAPNDATKYLDGTGAWSTPSGGGGGGSWTLVKKTADQTRTNTTTNAADSELTCSLSANKTYIIRGVIFVSGTLNCGFKWNFNVTTAAPVRVTVQRYWEPLGSAALQGVGTDTSVPTTEVGQTPGSGTPKKAIYFTAAIDTHATNAGTFSFQWAQNSPHASDLATVYKGSFFEYTSF